MTKCGQEFKMVSTLANKIFEQKICKVNEISYSLHLVL